MATHMNEVLMMLAILIHGDCYNIYVDNEARTHGKNYRFDSVFENHPPLLKNIV